MNFPIDEEEAIEKIDREGELPQFKYEVSRTAESIRVLPLSFLRGSSRLRPSYKMFITIEVDEHQISEILGSLVGAFSNTKHYYFLSHTTSSKIKANFYVFDPTSELKKKVLDLLKKIETAGYKTEVDFSFSDINVENWFVVSITEEPVIMLKANAFLELINEEQSPNKLLTSLRIKELKDLIGFLNGSGLAFVHSIYTTYLNGKPNGVLLKFSVNPYLSTEEKQGISRFVVKIFSEYVKMKYKIEIKEEYIHFENNIAESFLTVDKFFT